MKVFLSIDMSVKAFDFISFDFISYSLINAKIQTYGFNKDAFVLLYVFTKNVRHDFQIFYFRGPSRIYSWSSLS